MGKHGGVIDRRHRRVSPLPSFTCGGKSVLKGIAMGFYLARIIDDEGEQAATRIMTSSRQDAARAMVREVLIGNDDGLYVGLVRVWDAEDKDDPGTLYGWEAMRELPEGFNEDDEELDVDIKLDDRS